MAFHHVALATRDLTATHAFYTDAMGFDLVKVNVSATPEGGWARHLFYDTHGSGLIAFWDIHDGGAADFDPSISRGLGLPHWSNHLAFDAPDLDALARARDRWLEHELDVAEIDHGWCVSIYATDPNGIMVEFCCTTRAFDDTDRSEARRLLAAEAPDLEPMPDVRFYAPAGLPTG